MKFPWRVQAGPEALHHLRCHGWRPEDFSILMAASGGPKWLVLSALDRVLVKSFANTGPLHLLGSSSGAYRFAAYTQANPERALAQLEQAYIEADWSAARPLSQLRQTAAGIIRSFLQPGPLNHPNFRLHVCTALCKGWLASDHRLLQASGLLGAAVLAALGRRWLSQAVERVLFSDPRTPLPSGLRDLTSRRLNLSEHNLMGAVLASGAIPLVLPGERQVDPAAAGCLRDGGLVDYHFDQLQLEPAGLILYPHFAPGLQPGWLERFGPKRRVKPEVYRRMVLLSPTQEWIAGLPNGKVPCRQDATGLSQRKRRQAWHEAARRGQDLAEHWSPEHFLAHLQPLSL